MARRPVLPQQMLAEINEVYKISDK